MNTRTVNEEPAVAVVELQAVLEEIGLQAMLAQAGTDADLVLPGGTEVEVRSAVRPTSSQLRKWGIDDPGTSDRITVLIADWIDAQLRTELDSASWGWLDRSGHLRLVGGGVHIDRDVEPLLGPEPQSANPLRRPSGLAVAIAMLERRAALAGDEWGASIRDVAVASNVSVGSAHKAIAEMMDLGLLSSDGGPRSSLFWMAAREWSVRWFPLMRAPSPDVSETMQRLLRFRFEDPVDAGWALAGDEAAAAHGAPIVAEGPPRILVPDRRALTWALRTFGEAAEGGSAPAFVGCAPTVAAVLDRRDSARWPLVRPMVAALELASSGPRGRDALERWSERPWGIDDD